KSQPTHCHSARWHFSCITVWSRSHPRLNPNPILGRTSPRHRYIAGAGNSLVHSVYRARGEILPGRSPARSGGGPPLAAHFHRVARFHWKFLGARCGRVLALRRGILPDFHRRLSGTNSVLVASSDIVVSERSYLLARTSHPAFSQSRYCR